MSGSVFGLQTTCSARRARGCGRSIWFGSPDLSCLGHYCRLVSAARSYNWQTNQTTVLLSVCRHHRRLALVRRSSLAVSSKSCPVRLQATLKLGQGTVGTTEVSKHCCVHSHFFFLQSSSILCIQDNLAINTEMSLGALDAGAFSISLGLK